MICQELVGIAYKAIKNERHFIGIKAKPEIIEEENQGKGKKRFKKIYQKIVEI